jgi:hypothetical protein
MTTFSDGPAKGKRLMLRRTPIFLRVVVGPDGAVDALDQLDDEPRPDERLYAYRFVRDGGSVHINSRDASGRRNGGFYRIAEYAPVEPQPADDQMRAWAAWVAWTEARYAQEAAS